MLSYLQITKELPHIIMLHYVKKKLLHILSDSPSVQELSISAPIPQLQQFLNTFQADEYGHRASQSTGDLGYGWIHYGLLRTMKPQRVLCVGSRHGYIPAVLAQACKDNSIGHVSFVDAGYGADDANSWTGEGYWKTTQGKEVFHKAFLDNHITLYVATTEEYAQKYPEMTYDYIYIDGEHSYEGALRDHNLFWPQLNNHGLMVFHDICVKETLPEGKYGVHRVWQKIKQEHGAYLEMVFIGSGLGVVQKNPRSTIGKRAKSR